MDVRHIPLFNFLKHNPHKIDVSSVVNNTNAEIMRLINSSTGSNLDATCRSVGQYYIAQIERCMYTIPSDSCDMFNLPLPVSGMDDVKYHLHVTNGDHPDGVKVGKYRNYTNIGVYREDDISTEVFSATDSLYDRLENIKFIPNLPTRIKIECSEIPYQAISNTGTMHRGYIEGHLSFSLNRKDVFSNSGVVTHSFTNGLCPYGISIKEISPSVDKVYISIRSINVDVVRQGLLYIEAMINKCYSVGKDDLHSHIEYVMYDSNSTYDDDWLPMLHSGSITFLSDFTKKVVQKR